jgi:hypothetical protein
MNLNVSKSARGRLAIVMVSGLLMAALLPISGAMAANGGATKLVITANSLGGGHATAGLAFDVTVQAQDGASAPATGFTDSVTFTSSDAQATVSPGSPYTYLAGDNGTKTFSVTLKTAGNQTITFSSAGLTAATTTVTVDVTAATQLKFTTQPAFGTPNAAFAAQPVVAVQDAYGNTITSGAAATTTVTLTLTNNTAGGTLVCNQASNQMNAVAGVAAFSGCRVNNAQIGYTLTASDPGALTDPVSSAFDVANTLVFTTQPAATAKGGVAFTTQPVVEIRAGASKAVNTNTPVTLSINTSTVTGGTLACTANTVTSVAGVATFAACSLDKIGTYTLRAATAALFTVSNNVVVSAGLATKLTFTTQPAGAVAGAAFITQPVVSITDAGGNVVTSGVTANVTLSIGTNPGVPAGVLTCTPNQTVATASTGANAGRAVFAGCKITNAGVGYTLVATATNVVCTTGSCATPGALTTGTSAAFTVTAPAAAITLTTSAPKPPGAKDPVILWGQGFTLSVQFAANGANKQVQLQGTRDLVTWTPITTLTMDANGRASVFYTPVTNLFYRAVFAGAPDLVAGNSNQVRTVVRELALLRPTNNGTTKTINRNTSITFTTTVRPSRPELTAATVTYYLYRQVSGTWRLATTRTVAVDSAGLAKTTIKFASTGQWYVRSRANPTPYNANSVLTPIERYSVR